MSVESQPGEGTTFTIYMPKVYERPESLYQPNRIDDLFVGTETVLVVEDESVVRDLTTEVLQRQGYRLLSASNGAEAVEIMEGSSEQIDLLLTDVIMPIMGGHELAQRYSQAYPDGKVLYISGYPTARVSDHNLLGPEGAFLQKPITLAELTLKVREALDWQPKAGTAGTKIAD
jgi:CheY-like chemotaxis protein